MRTKSPFLFVLLAALLSISLKPLSKSPEFEWKSKTLDLGKVIQNQTAKGKFEFSNSGKAPLVLSKVQANCGCTEVEYPRNPIFPEEKANIQVSFSSNQLGKFSKSIIVNANTKYGAEVLTLTGEVIEPPVEEKKQ